MPDVKKRKTKKSAQQDFALGKEPANGDEYRLLANALVQWAQKDTSLNINDFFLNLLLSPNSVKNFFGESEYFSRAYDIALRLIGSRRERLAREGVIHPQLVIATMPLYDAEYRKWLIAVRQKDEAHGETKIITVQIPEYCSVPESIWQLMSKHECTKEEADKRMEKVYAYLNGREVEDKKT